ncbi:MAG: hypothetical protein VYE77_00065 [Planctomycetota bacterium]|nr:hypothetical protein [Planctomycetota bacterium]
MNEPTALPVERSRLWRRGIVFTLLLAGMVFGVLQLSFLCDDAYINFRYASNAYLGHGPVWNAAPFLPVEGYTSPLWVFLLWAFWSAAGIEPPEGSNILSLLFGVGQFAVIAAVALRLRSRSGSRLPDIVAFVLLAVIVSNRTFLSWLSSGMDTALFNLAFISWVVMAFRPAQRRTIAWLLGWSAVAVVAAMTRPDGVLFAAATGATAVWMFVRRERPRLQVLLALTPLLVIGIHLLWRYSYYGAWLPNTYYAKVSDSWPEAGWRYFGSFVVEHGVWLWIPLCLVWVVVECSRGLRQVGQVLWAHVPAVLAVGAVLFHWVYYTFKVGGDHFEYRVYSQLVPLGLLAAAAMAARLASGWWFPVTVLVALWLASGVGWVHLWLTRDMPWYGFRPIAGELPAAAQPLGRWFDRNQAWLRFRNVGLRCQYHKLFLDMLRENTPDRAEVDAEGQPCLMLDAQAVGLMSWSLPNVAIRDLYGLNDWVVARAPIPPLVPPFSPEVLRELFYRADRNGDEAIDRGELQAALRFIKPLEAGRRDESEYLSVLFMNIYARERPGYLTEAEFVAIGKSLQNARSMAHERLPPYGYVEELPANLVVRNRRARVDAGDEPLTAERIRSWEEKWWADTGR